MKRNQFPYRTQRHVRVQHSLTTATELICRPIYCRSPHVFHNHHRHRAPFRIYRMAICTLNRPYQVQFISTIRTASYIPAIEHFNIQKIVILPSSIETIRHSNRHQFYTHRLSWNRAMWQFHANQERQAGPHRLHRPWLIFRLHRQHQQCQLNWPSIRFTII